MIALEPEENRSERTRRVEEARAHGEAHRAPGGVGWTELHVVPPPPVRIAIRKLTLDALCDVIGPSWRRAAKLVTGYSTHREDVVAGYAFVLDEGPAIYGRTSDLIITQINVIDAAGSAASALHRLGARFHLVLCDLWSDQIVELASPQAVAGYLASLDE